MYSFTREKAESVAREPLVGAAPSRPPRRFAGSRAHFAVLAVVFCALFYLQHLADGVEARRQALSAAGLETCAWGTLEAHAGLLAVPPVGRDEFLARQAALAENLDDLITDFLDKGAVRLVPLVLITVIFVRLPLASRFLLLLARLRAGG